MLLLFKVKMLSSKWHEDELSSTILEENFLFLNIASTDFKNGNKFLFYKRLYSNANWCTAVQLCH